MAEMQEKRININMLIFWILFIAFVLVMIYAITRILKNLTGG
jgi:uncharacterized protein with PQ loop repeat